MTPALAGFAALGRMPKALVGRHDGIPVMARCLQELALGHGEQPGIRRVG